MFDSWEDALNAVRSERFRPRRGRALLALLGLLLALAGPWAYSADGVPPPTWCDPPYILLTPDRCVRHVPGGEIMAYAAMGPVAVGELIAGKYSIADVAREMPFRLWILLPWLPLATTLLLWTRPAKRRRHVFHAASLALALLATVSLALFDVLLGRRVPPLWGIWFYIFLLVAALALELRLLLAARRVRRHR